MPVTLKFQWDNTYEADALDALRDTGVKQRQLLNSRLLLGLKHSKAELGSTRESNRGPPDVQPYVLATTPPR
ncbi:unnamed protein product, partial [Brenthis ino]